MNSVKNKEKKKAKTIAGIHTWNWKYEPEATIEQKEKACLETERIAGFPDQK